MDQKRRIDLQTKMMFLWFREDPANFIFSGLIRTKDEIDKDSSVKPFPDKAYLREIVAEVHQHDVLFIPKSRQMMATWALSAYCLWLAMFHDHQAIIVQSKKETDAANVVFNKNVWTRARISFMYYYLPTWLKRMIPAQPSFCHLSFSNGSNITAVPEGADIVRSNVASLIFFDEAAFQPQFALAFGAAKPMARKICAVSSADPSFFFETIRPALKAMGF